MAEVSIVPDEGVIAAFPRLTRDNNTWSAASPAYNCVAWSLGIEDESWWPDRLGFQHWPESVPRERTVDAFAAVFAENGFVERAWDGSEGRWLALYARSGRPARDVGRLQGDWWTSKLGFSYDVEHRLRDLEGDPYGQVVASYFQPSP